MLDMCVKEPSSRIAVALLVGAVLMYLSMYCSSVRNMKTGYNPQNNTNISDDPPQGEINKTYRPPDHQDNAQEVRHIAFLKVHKCASSTVLNLMYRFGMERGLTYVLPVKGNYIRFEKTKITELPPALHSDYDMLCNHVLHFDKSAFAHYLPPDTAYLAIVRDPLQRMQSAFNYYRDVQHDRSLLDVEGDNPFETYLKNPEYYESKWAGSSRTNNNMAKDFGFPYDDFRNESKFASYLQTLDKTFQLVMVLELFDESLVLLRRMLNWPLANILYIAKNAHSSVLIPEADVTSQVEPFLALDRLLYDHFVSQLKKTINAAGGNFQEEVKYFRKMNKRAGSFCDGTKTLRLMHVKASLWNEAFKLTKEDCVRMKLNEITFLGIIRKKHMLNIDRFGANMTKLLHR